MLVDKDINRGGTVSPAQYGNGQKGTAQNRNAPEALGTTPSRKSKSKDRRGLFAILSVLLLVMLILAAVRMTSVVSGNNDQLVLKIGDQQQALIDLRQSIPISPY